MEAITYTEARNGLAAALDRVVNDRDITIITRQKGEAAVLMSLKDYESLTETAYLLKSPANARRLLKAVEEVEKRRRIVKKNLAEA